MPKLTIETLKREAQAFSRAESLHKEKSLFGITDGKKVGTYLEYKFKELLRNKYNFEEANSANGIGLPSVQIDIQFTDIYQPYSSYHFKSVRQKIYGLGCSLLWFMYEKIDDTKSKSATLNILHTLFMNRDRTADFRTTKGLISILESKGNKDDLMAFMFDAHLLADESEAGKLADEILSNPPELGYVGVSNALNWQMQYSKAIERASQEKHIDLLFRVS